MYYWIVILFSLVTIMTYKMSARQDDFDRRTVPMMEASVASLVQQHNAALKYVKNPSTSLVGDTVLNRSVYQEYGAYGLSEKKVNNLPAYKTIVFCVDKTDGSQKIDCDDTDAVNFLVTYGDIPSRWREPSQEGYFLTVLGRYTGRTTDVGIVEAASPATTGASRGSNRVINSAAGRKVYIPQRFNCTESVDSLGKVAYVTKLTSTDIYVEAASGSCD